MTRISVALFALAALAGQLACVPCGSGQSGADADPMFGITLPPGYRDWSLISVAHACVEATVRFAAELGYAITAVKDATTSYSDDHMHAALDINMPNYASAIVITDQLVESLDAGARADRD
jgi:hypothetical protein